MLKLKQTLLTLTLIALAFFTSCSDDSLNEQITFGDKISLSKSKIYLTYEGTYNGHLYRDYAITDGTYTNNSGDGGWSIDDYTNASYVFVIEIGVPVANDLGPGSYPQLYDWSDAVATDNVGYVYFENPADGTDYYRLYSPDGNDHSPVVVSGGIEDGKTMTIKFKGKLSLYHYNGTAWTTDSQDVSLAIQSKVTDARELNPPNARK